MGLQVLLERQLDTKTTLNYKTCYVLLGLMPSRHLLRSYTAFVSLYWIYLVSITSAFLGFIASDWPVST